MSTLTHPSASVQIPSLLPVAPIAGLAPVIPAENPRDSWPAWTDDDRWEPVPDDDEPRPTAGPDFIPSDLDDAEWAGMSLRLEGEPMAELAGTTSTALLLRFAIGQWMGLEARLEAERLERLEHGRGHCQRLDRMAADPATPGPRETDGYTPGYCY